jgi:hypothetical protein
MEALAFDRAVTVFVDFNHNRFHRMISLVVADMSILGKCNRQAFEPIALTAAQTSSYGYMCGLLSMCKTNLTDQLALLTRPRLAQAMGPWVNA